MTIGQRISKLRKEFGYTQEYVAEKLQVTRQAVSKWELDLTCPDSWNLIELARLFNTTVEHLTLGTGNAESDPAAPPIPTKSYCGRDCAACDCKQTLSCSGCKYEQGLPVQRCDIAACCGRAGLKACNQCRSADSCKLLSNRDTFSAKRCEKQASDNERRSWQRRTTVQCGIWFAILPLMAVGNLLLDLFLLDLLPPLALVFGFGYCLCLFKLAKQSEHFKTAGIVMAVMAILRCAAGCLVDSSPVFIAAYQLLRCILIPIAAGNGLHGCECVHYLYSESQWRIFSTLRGAFWIVMALELVGLIGTFFESGLLALLYLAANVAYCVFELIHIIVLFKLKGLVGRSKRLD